MGGGGGGGEAKKIVWNGNLCGLQKHLSLVMSAACSVKHDPLSLY